MERGNNVEPRNKRVFLGAGDYYEFHELEERNLTTRSRMNLPFFRSTWRALMQSSEAGNPWWELTA
jgi:hypothetical protein